MGALTEAQKHAILSAFTHYRGKARRAAINLSFPGLTQTRAYRQFVASL